MKGRPLVAASWVGTGIFAVTAVAATAGASGFPAVVVALLLFAASIPLSLYALARGAVRTAQNSEFVTVYGLFFLSRSAPPSVRLHLFGSLGACLVVTVGTASAEPFGVLVPVWPLAVCGAWAARHGTFPPIRDPSR